MARRCYSLLHPFVCPLFILLFFVTNGYGQTKLFTATVYDYDTRQPMEGVSISVVGQSYTAVTDSNGKFALSLPGDYYTLLLTSVGYQRTRYRINVAEQDIETIYLKRSDINELEEVIVETRKKDAAVKDVQMGMVLMNPARLKRMPLLFGEADIVKTLTLQPGIVTTGETVSGYSVRGGYTDQNLVLVDEAPVFNISHLLGIYTGISADAVQTATFYKAGIPAQYGGRLSSLLLLNVNPGNPDTMHYTTGAGLMSSHFFLNGPIVKKKLSIMTGGRIAYPKLMMNLFPGNVGKSDAFFYDANLKLSFTPNEKNRISATYYHSYDRFQFPGDTSYAWKNTAASLQWKYVITPKLTMQWVADYGQYTSYINGLENGNSYQLSNSVQQRQTKAFMNYAFNDDHQLMFGGDVTRYNIQPGHLVPTGNSTINDKRLEPENAVEAAAYISTDHKLTSFLQLQAGVRFTQYQYLGPKTVYGYQAGEPKTMQSISDTTYYPKNTAIKTYRFVEPRLLFRFLLNSSTAIKLSYNRTQQNLHLISNTYAITPVDYWKLSDAYIQPQQADQYAIGIYKNFKDNSYETSVEAYYKDMQHTVEYKNGADLSLNPALETQLLPGKAYAYGVEFSIRKTAGKATGLASYTYSRTFTKVLSPFSTEQVNQGAYFPGNTDIPHNLGLSGSVQLGNGWLFSSNFVYRSGRTATFPDGSYIINGTIVTNYSQRNADRYPAYHRLDVAVSHDGRRYMAQRRYSVFNFSFYNLYGRANVYSIYFIRTNNLVKAYKLSVVSSIIPSFTWTYNF